MIMTLIGVAMGATGNVEYCAKFDVTFDRAKNANGAYNYAVGWYWSNNTINQKARGVFVEVSDYVSTQTVQLGSDGCAFVDAEGNPAYSTISTTVKVLNEAEFNGVDVALRQGSNSTFWVNLNDVSVTFTKVIVSDGNQYNLVVPAANGWQQMAIAGFMLDRVNWRLEDEVGRDCCLESGSMDLDGTCSGSNPAPYTRNSDPYLTSAPLVALSANANSASCCGSKRIWSSNTEESALNAGENVQNRFTLSHELGHVFAGIRMGGWESGQYGANPPLDGCNGDWSPVPPRQPLPQGDRGIIGKEFTARAFREGWAEFVKTWTWNRKPEAEPAVCVFIFSDYDLDGDIDNDYGVDHPYTTCYKLGGSPELTTVAGDPTDPWATSFGTNWLEQAISNVGTCVETTACPTTAGDSDMERWNRTTIYDVSDMFWTLYHSDDVPVQDLLSLYVDMCPRGWRENDEQTGSSIECSVKEDLPYERAKLSAVKQGLKTEVEDALDDHIEH